MKNPEGAREYPVCAAGWALWVTGGSPHLLYSHRGYRRVGEASRLQPPRRGLLLGRLGGVSGKRKLPALACRQRSGEFRRGKRMCPAASPAIFAGRAAGARGRVTAPASQ